tara:strand:+ start:835 stop:1362 length:528 start_codon:yes stop_codon:yes gene_type:complete
MLQQNFYPSKIIEVVPSDTINIPNPGSATITGVADNTVVGKLEDSTQNFAVSNGNPVAIGDIVFNTRDTTIATVTAIDSPTVLSISADIMANTEGYTIYRKDRNLGCLIYVTSIDRATYTIAGISAGGDDFSFDLPFGGNATSLNSILLPFQVLRINDTGTTAAPGSIKIYALFN